MFMQNEPKFLGKKWAYVASVDGQSGGEEPVSTCMMAVPQVIF